MRKTLLACALAAATGASGQNMLDNPNFDTDLSSWMEGPFGSCDPDATTGYPSAGSAACTSIAGTSPTQLTQCIDVVGSGVRYDFGAYCFLPIPGMPLTIGFCKSNVSWYSAPACSGFLGSSEGPRLNGVNNWYLSALSAARSPAGTQSARVLMTVEPFGDSFTAKFDAAFFQRALAKGDQDGDYRADLVFANALTNRHVVWFMDGLNRLSGTFVVPDPPAALRLGGVADVGGDRKADLVFHDPATGQVQVWNMIGANRTGPAQTLAATLAAPWRLAAVGDVTRDVQPDLIWQNGNTGQLLVWVMSGTVKTGEIVPIPDRPADANWRLIGAVDFDGDAQGDFLWYNVTSGRVVQWLERPPLLERSAGRFTIPPAAGDANWKVVATADYGPSTGGETGLNDVVWRNDTTGRIVVWKMDAAATRLEGAFTNPNSPADALNWQVVGPR